MKLLPLLILLLGCRSETPVAQNPVRTEAAFLYDSRGIADGCENHVRLYTSLSGSTSSTVVAYKPTAATLPIFMKALDDIPPSATSSERAVVIRFTETGKQVDLLCGWGTSSKVGEIDILSIAKP